MKQLDRTQARPSSARLRPMREERAPTALLAPAPEELRNLGEIDRGYTGQTIDERYVLEAVIGEGGMGVVYRCRHRIIGKKLAMKIIRAEVAGSQEATQRFLIEAKAASAIGSEHIIHVSDFGRLPDGASYLVMELLEGTPLADEFREHWPLPIPRILSILTQLAEGLGAAHEAGIVHRDLKPENIFLVRRGNEPDFVKILDFGIAKMSLDGDANLTRAGTVVGTPRYMSPEQAAGEVVDHRGDIYSLGVLAYELIAGRVPFDGEHPLSILSKHMYEAPPKFDSPSLRARVPAELERIVWKCLAKRPADRYRSMEELALELQRFGASSVANLAPARELQNAGAERPAMHTEVTARLARPSTARQLRRSLRVVLYCALGLTLLVVGSFWVLTKQRGESLADSVPLAPSTIAAAPASAAREPSSTPAEPVVIRVAEPVPQPAPQPAAAGADAKAGRRPLPKQRPRRDQEQTEFVNPWPSSP
ncbi:MAG: serine/threonine-protein kinase [Deltaproteobacteria bacterium]